MLQFLTPGNFMVVGPTNSGKTTFVRDLLLNWNDVCTTKVDRIYVFYEKWQENYEQLKLAYPQKMVFIHELKEGFAKMLTQENHLNKICVFDDQMTALSENQNRVDMEKLFITSRHNRLSLIYISHNLFYKEQRSISLNATYFVIFSNPRDISQIGYLARRMYSVRKVTDKFFKVYHQATSKKFGYLFIDYRPNTKHEFRLLSDIFGDFPTVYPIN